MGKEILNIPMAENAGDSETLRKTGNILLIHKISPEEQKSALTYKHW